MLAAPGNSYRLSLVLGEAGRLHPAWLVGAVRATYPRAEVASVKKTSATAAEAVLRWRAAPGQIQVGDVLQPVAEGLQVPGLTLPSATVSAVEALDTPATNGGGVVVRSGIFERPAARNAGKLALAVVLVGVSAYFTHRIGAKHAKSRRA